MSGSAGGGHSNTLHASDFGLRFPRIVRIRHDKGPGAISTLADIARLHAARAASPEAAPPEPPW